MPESYENFRDALRAWAESVGVPAAENAWTTRPDAQEYIVFAIEYEPGADTGDNRKLGREWEGSVDLFSRNKHGNGVQLQIERLLDEHFECSWRLNHYAWEPETGLFHWEWVFNTEE